MAEKTVLFKIRRQDSPSTSPRWEEFELAWHSGMNVISSMMEIARNPITRQGKATTPITYDSNCLEEVCGSCAMLINGKARMACSALIDNLEKPIRLEPLSKFPVVLLVQTGLVYHRSLPQCVFSGMEPSLCRAVLLPMVRDTSPPLHRLPLQPSNSLVQR